ncbi:MAG: membrane dipeptidase [Arenicella sp.]|jgi:membrane dipeptidase
MKNCITSLICLSTIAIAASVNAAHHESGASDAAQSLAQNSIIMDGHIDVPYRLHSGWVDVTKATVKGDFDYIRAKKGGLNGPFMSVYIPAELDDSDESTQLAHQLIDNVEAIVGRAPDKFAIAMSADDIEAQFEKGLISLPMGMENGSPIQGDLKNLDVFYKRGIRYITLTHAKSNHISDSSYDENRQWDGLSPFGEKVVSEMNRLGIMVDISHVSDAAFYDAVEISKAPMIASHSSLRSFTPNFERNMDDAMVKALAKNGGVIMINFGSTFLSAQARAWSDQQKKELAVLVEKHGEDSDVAKGFSEVFRAKNPLPYADVAKVVDHIDHAVKLVGIDHIGLGSDYDGVGDSLPTGLKDVAAYPNLIQGLLDRNYSNGDIKKILGGNTLRVWRAVEAAAE